MLSALFLAGALMAPAQVPMDLPPTPRFRQYGFSEGLPSSRVYTTAQDHDGFIWVGTGDGLARFDGQSFTVHRHDPDNPASLPGNDISALLVDHAGRLWLGGGQDSGLARLRADGSGFERWRHDPEDPRSLSGGDVMALAEDAAERLWVGVYARGLNRMNADGSSFERWRHDEDDPASLVSDNVYAVHATASGRVWIGTDRGLDVIDVNDRLHHVRFAGDVAAPSVWQVRGKDGDLRVGTSVGLYRVGTDGVARPWPEESFRDKDVFASHRDRNGDVWVAARGALYLFSVGHAAWRFPAQPLIPGALPAQIVLDIQSDSEGGLWIASADSGLLYLSPDWREFSRFVHRPEDRESLRDNRIMALAWTDPTQLLAGSMAGHLDRIDSTSGRSEPMPGSEALPATSILSLGIAPDDRIWIGTQRELYTLADGSLERIADPRLPGMVRHMVADADGALVSPLGRGMYRVAAATRAVSPVALAFETDEDLETLALGRVGETVWRGSKAGLSRLAEDGSRFLPVIDAGGARVDALAGVADLLWLARPDALEAYRIDGADLTLVQRVRSADGLPAIAAGGLFLDRDGRVWITSRGGLWCFDPPSASFVRYGAEDGLPSPEFTVALATRDDGAVFAGTLGGIAGFRPELLLPHVRRPQLVLAGVSVLRAGRRVELGMAGDLVPVAWDDEGLRVAVKALSYVSPERVRYRFRMQGLDAEWVATDGLAAREFPGLPAGRHHLEVQAASVGDYWADLPAKLVFDVALPPWRRPWAWVAYALLLLAAGVVVWRLLQLRLQRRLQLQVLREQRRLAEEANAAKTRFLATMGHEIRTPMTGVLGMAELLGNTPLNARQGEMLRTIRRSGEVLLKLVNDALDLARIEAGRLELVSQAFDPRELVRGVVALGAGLAEAKGVALEVECAADVPARVVGDEVRVRQILMNLVNNALKFTEHGEVVLSLEPAPGGLRFRVRDSGPGMDEALQHRLFHRFEQGDGRSGSGGTGLGLAICRELSQLMGGSIAVDSRPGAGATFAVVLPLPASAASPAGESRPGGATSPPGSRDILLVEDDATIAEILAGLLREDGHEVRHAPHALAALAALEERAGNTILVDLDLPDLDGFELIRMLRARPDGRSWHIVVVTARSNRDDEVMAREAGADAFLRKPVTGRELRHVLGRGTAPEG